MTVANTGQLGGSILVGIKFNALTAGGSAPPKPSFQARSADAASGAAPDDQTLNPDSGATSTGSAGQAAAGDSTSGGGDGAGSANTGPSAQTRNAQASQAQGTTRPRSRATGSASSQPAATPQAATDDAGSNFGSVMATALGRSAVSAAGSVDVATSTKSATGSTDATSPSGAVQPAGTPADAMAWIAQVMMTPGAAQPPTGLPATGAADATTGGRVGAAAGRSTAGTGLPAALGATADDTDDAPTAATLAAANAIAAGQSPANPGAAKRLLFNADPATPDAGEATAQTTDAQTAATTAAATPDAANFSALADVQKLISGMTTANAGADADAGSASATPSPHAATGSGSMDPTQAAAALQAASLTRTGAGLGTTTISIQAPVGSAAFADEVGSRVTSLAQSGITQAQLQLNPADLGPVQVHITMQSGQASVWFGAAHADTRAALEQSLPRLREMFAGAGLPLGDSGVFREPPQQQRAQVLAGGNSRTTDGDIAATASVTQVANVRLSLLDTYA
jgi:flagellar hook-length control protein FliK